MALVLVAGCSARGGGGGGNPFDTDSGTTGDGATMTGDNPNPPPPPPPGNFNCSDYCTRATSVSSCSGLNVGECTSGCMNQLSMVPSSCSAQLGDYGVCLRTATLICRMPGQVSASGCDAQAMSLAACIVSAPRPDAGTGPNTCAQHDNCLDCTGASSCGWCDGRCLPGSSSGPSMGSCGGARWSWTTDMCAER